jgi:hypothetical protein
MQAPLVRGNVIPILVLLLGFAIACALGQGSSNPGQSNTATTRTNNPDGSTTVTTTTTYKDGSTTTTTNYDKDGHDAGTTRTDVTTKDGETTTTTTKYDGSGHETGRTIEQVDKDGNKTTTTYDAQGHQIITTVRPAAPKAAPKNPEASLEGIVVPDGVHDRQPFTFAVPQGSDQVSIQTLNGVVVDSRPPDKYGRVFLPAGLAAGAYLISLKNRDGHDANNAGKIDVRPSDALQRSWEHAPQQVQIDHPPQSVKVGDPLWLSGRGFSPNCTDMQASLFSSGQTHTANVLAATEDQLKLAPITEMKPGPAELKITNLATHQSAPSQPLFFYDLQAHLQQNKLKRGQQTTMVLEALPANTKMQVHATISGQATFSGGRTEIDAVIEHGRLAVPVEADRGAGNFHIDFEGQPEELPQHASCGCGCGGTAQPGCAHKGCSCAGASVASTQPSAPEYAGCSCGCGGTAQPACAHKGCACSKALAAAAELKRQQASCSCGCGGTAQPACAHKACVCSKAAAAGDVPVSLTPRLENVSRLADKPTGKASCKCGCGGTAQPRCAHKACGCGS